MCKVFVFLFLQTGFVFICPNIEICVRKHLSLFDDFICFEAVEELGVVVGKNKEFNFKKCSFHHRQSELKSGVKVKKTRKNCIERVWIIACLIDSFFLLPYSFMVLFPNDLALIHSHYT